MPQASTREHDNEDALPLCDTPISLETLELRCWRRSFTIRLAGVAELADALDSKSSDRKIVWVRAPPPAVVSVGIVYLRRIFESFRKKAELAVASTAF